MAFKNSDFVHLHVHSEYSQFDGLAPISDLVLTARKMGFPAIALTDHGVVAGWIKFLKECYQTKDKKGKEIPYAPIKPILGSEVYLARKMDWKSKDYQPEGKKGNRHLNLWAKNHKGYQNLCALSEKSWIDGFYSNPRIDLELLANHSEGLICGTACLSSFINANLLHDRYDKAKQGCIILKDIFGEDLFLEVMYHGITSERLIIPDIYKLSKELDIPIISTNDCHYVRQDQAKSHEVLMCMSTSNCITNPNHLHFPYDEFYLKSAEEMGIIFKDTPQVIYNTLAVADRIDSEDIMKNLFGGMRLPHFKIPDEYCQKGDFEGSFTYLKELAWRGMQERGWDKSEKHIERLKKELRDVRVAWENNGYDFAKYFLIEEDIMRYARESGILTGPGRGSGVASVLLHSLGIAYGLDPLEYNLLWERFLGFDDKYFIKESDFGFNEDKKEVNNSIEYNELDEDRDVEEDLGGVDRY